MGRVGGAHSKFCFAHPESLFEIVISGPVLSFFCLFFLVIDILDELKKEQREARDAIRWLENQFRLGNRYLQKTLRFFCILFLF